MVVLSTIDERARRKASQADAKARIALDRVEALENDFRVLKGTLSRALGLPPYMSVDDLES